MDDKWILTNRAPFGVELLGKTVRVVDFEGGDVLLIGKVSVAGVRDLAQSVATLLNAAADGLADLADA